MDLKTDYWRYYNSAASIDIDYFRQGKATKVTASITICGLTHTGMFLDTVGDPMLARQLALEAACERFYENIMRANGGYAIIADRLRHANPPSITHIHAIHGVLSFYDKVEVEHFKYLHQDSNIPPLVMYKVDDRWMSHMEHNPELARGGFQYFVEGAQNAAVEYFGFDADSAEDGKDMLSLPAFTDLRRQIRHAHSLIVKYWGNPTFANEAKTVNAKEWSQFTKEGMELIVRSLAPMVSFILDHYKDYTIEQMVTMVAKRGLVFIYGEDKKLAFHMSGYDLSFDTRGGKIPLSPIL
jgi:hypothetical protein